MFTGPAPMTVIFIGVGTRVIRKRNKIRNKSNKAKGTMIKINIFKIIVCLNVMTLGNKLIRDLYNSLR
jgi:hypothetical protein